MNRWCQPHRARRHAVQRSFDRLTRVDLLAVRRWFMAEGFDGLLVEALGPPRGKLLAACGMPAPPCAEWLKRWAATIVELERVQRRPASVLDWFLDQTFLQVAHEVRRAAGPSTLRTIERALADRGAERDELAIDAVFTATVVAAIDAAENCDAGRPIESWLCGIAVNVVRGAARVERGALTLPRADVDPDNVGRGVAAQLDHDDELEWLSERALRGQAQRAGEAVVVAHVLDGDRPAAEVAAELGVSLARLYKRATAARTRLREAAMELRSTR